ncbi:MAG: alpha/beta hydrolase family protein [Euzebya sp.]
MSHSSATVRPFEFPGTRGTTLAGLLHVPDGPAVGSILMAHCFTCSKDLPVSRNLARGLADRGYAVLRFDFTGLGESEGDFASTTVSSNVEDLNRAAVALISEGFGPCGMLGHSLGGAAVLLAASRLKSVRSVAVIGAPFDIGHVRRHFGAAVAEITRHGEADVELAGRQFTIRRSFLEDLDTHPQGDHITALGRPLLVVHAVQDQTVAVEQAEKIFAAAQQPKGFLPLLAPADHLLSDRHIATWLAGQLADWFDRTRG